MRTPLRQATAVNLTLLLLPGAATAQLKDRLTQIASVRGAAKKKALNDADLLVLGPAFLPFVRYYAGVEWTSGSRSRCRRASSAVGTSGSVGTHTTHRLLLNFHTSPKCVAYTGYPDEPFRCACMPRR